MRYIVITLFLANAIYFGWRFLAAEPDVASTAQTVIDKSQIALIDDDVSDDSVIEKAPEKKIEHESEPEKTENAEAIEPVNPVINETPAEVSDEPGKPELPLETVVSEVVTKLVCVQTPWTRDEKTLTAWREKNADAAVETLTQEVETQRRFLVYIPAKSTPEKTLDRLRELKSLPLESAHINKGEFIGGISLGLFSQQESADSVLKKVHDLGITDAKHTVRILTATEYRLRRQTSETVSDPWSPCL